mmetsp:Transcript_8772/g.23785  ORF Transcript_8772/g.23785 Transcript_8772/m.23785 type:complete len:214 (+) Transcript_8772:322-963(+)
MPLIRTPIVAKTSGRPGSATRHVSPSWQRSTTAWKRRPSHDAVVRFVGTFRRRPSAITKAQHARLKFSDGNDTSSASRWSHTGKAQALHFGTRSHASARSRPYVTGTSARRRATSHAASRAALATPERTRTTPATLPSAGARRRAPRVACQAAVAARHSQSTGRNREMMTSREGIVAITTFRRPRAVRQPPPGMAASVRTARVVASDLCARAA